MAISPSSPSTFASNNLNLVSTSPAVKFEHTSVTDRLKGLLSEIGYDGNGDITEFAKDLPEDDPRVQREKRSIVQRVLPGRRLGDGLKRVCMRNGALKCPRKQLRVQKSNSLALSSQDTQVQEDLAQRFNYLDSETKQSEILKILRGIQNQDNFTEILSGALFIANENALRQKCNSPTQSTVNAELMKQYDAWLGEILEEFITNIDLDYQVEGVTLEDAITDCKDRTCENLIRNGKFCPSSVPDSAFMLEDTDGVSGFSCTIL